MVSATPQRTILAVDGNSLAHRAYHAMTGGNDAVGHFVTAGVVAMLGSVWGQGPFDGIVMAFDHAHNQRREDWPLYKADRATDPVLRDHLQALPTHMEACGFRVEMTRGAEADDLLAAAADGCTARGWRCAILSSDRDLTALVSDTVTLLRPRATMSDLRVYDPAAVHREYGVSPQQYTDLAAMRGDPADGLEGVHGIGPKIAARLLRDHGSLGGIYANLHHLPPKIEAALRAGREVAERNRLLMSPLPNLAVDVDAAVTSGVDLARIERSLTALGIPAAATRFRWAVDRPAPPRPPFPPLPEDEPRESAVPDSVRARRGAQAIADQADQHALF